MCTVSWFHENGGFTVLFNRDESRARRVGEPPRVDTTATGTRFLAPRDPDAGGTWIVVNEHGMVACLLNRYPADGQPQVSRPGASRGFIVRGLADAPSAGAALRQLEAVDLARYQPFTLLALDDTADVRRAAWDGVHLTHTVQPTMPLASSGESPEVVEAVRRDVWAQLTDAEPDDAARSVPARLLAFHRSHAPTKGALSPCMHRQEARTVSLTQVRVTRAAAAMDYAAGPPCVTPLAVHGVLNRVSRLARA